MQQPTKPDNFLFHPACEKRYHPLTSAFVKRERVQLQIEWITPTHTHRFPWYLCSASWLNSSLCAHATPEPAPSSTPTPIQTSAGIRPAHTLPLSPGSLDHLPPGLICQTQPHLQTAIWPNRAQQRVQFFIAVSSGNTFPLFLMVKKKPLSKDLAMCKTINIGGLLEEHVDYSGD